MFVCSALLYLLVIYNNWVRQRGLLTPIHDKSFLKLYNQGLCILHEHQLSNAADDGCILYHLVAMYQKHIFLWTVEK